MTDTHTTDTDDRESTKAGVPPVAPSAALAALPYPGFIVIDTETNRLADFKLPADHPDGARLAALTIIRTDNCLNEICRRDYLVKPDGWTIDPEAGAKNGLTTEFLAKNGTAVGRVLDEYVALIEQGLPVIAYNAQFDCKIMRGELRRANRDDLFMVTRNSCAMRGFSRLHSVRWPKLAEAFLTATGKPLVDGHKAEVDAMAALAIARYLHGKNALLPFEVHLAKSRP